ncbi:cytochrome b6-f complex iron-sulfur subunit [Mucilaginibacter pineti]|uniref:Cytochrome b6-f complex iron-sulfur subunit n=1 Tax=Mucilaginibacter pineti TaxID=1391627 RepID=A0A1G6T705_9SPHI|nr:Rieske 2Fe-2S domain-containing protein [Mucilaginibacter pineti]SDD24799.1 cytochrome b6-f complex iron-sulfur subunit [Mucilaginibacter pineti]
MQRQEFLSKLGISLAAVCVGCNLASCGSDVKNSDPTPGNNAPDGSGPLLTANLNSELQAIGGFKVAAGIILVRLAAGSVADSFTAVQVACTHQGTSINYNNAQGIFICPNHGSEFSTTGVVLRGPAGFALKQYKVNITGTDLTVTT